MQHMQKALHQMNLLLDNVISDITGVTGTAILEHILAGERDPVTLAGLRDCRIRATEEDIVNALQGDYREEHLFVLQQAYDAYQLPRRTLPPVTNTLKHGSRRLKNASMSATSLCLGRHDLGRKPAITIRHMMPGRMPAKSMASI